MHACAHKHTHMYTQFAQTKAQTAVLVISAPSESIWWIECLEVLRLTDGSRILNAAQKGTLCIAQGSCAHTHSYCNMHTDMHANAHALGNTNSAMHLNNLDSICFETSFFFPWESARVALGIRRGITGLIMSQGCRLSPLKFPPPQMKVAVEVEDGMQVFQLLNSSKLFDLLSSNCKSQVADSPVYEPSRCISPLVCGALWPDKLALFPTNEF